jgi:uncharacterized protein (TIGR03435 family)
MRLLATAAAALAVAMATAVTFAQAPAAPSAPLRFEVASVKPSNPNPGSPAAAVPLMFPPAGGRVAAQNMPLRLLVRLAYAVQDFQIVGGPTWQLSQKFDINGRLADAPAGAMPQQAVAPALRALLEDRFNLKVHHEPREGPTYALVIARSDGKLGPALTPSTSDCSGASEEAQKRLEALAKGGISALATLIPKPGETVKCAIAPDLRGRGPSDMGLTADGQPIGALIPLLTQYVGRPVTDKTGLTGLYDWQLHFDMIALAQAQAQQLGISLVPGTLPQTDAPALTTALQDELGLKLQSERGPIDMLVIDSAEMPTPD